MDIHVYTEEQVAKFRNPLLEGKADFQVVEAEETVSKTRQGTDGKVYGGNPMIALTLKVWDLEGHEGTIFDWLLDTETMAYKIRHFWESVGHFDVYERGKFSAHDCIGKSGICELKWQKSKDTQYPDRMTIKDYIKATEKNPPKKADDIVDDDLVF